MDKLRLALGFVAAISTVSALECSPRGKGALRKEAPLITAESRAQPQPQKIRFERGPDGHPRWSWPGMGHFDHMLADTRRDATPIRLALGRLEKHLDGQHAVVDRVVLSMTPETSGKTFSLGVELAETDAAYDEARFYSHEGWTLETGPLAEAEAGMPLVFAKGTSRIRFEPTYISPDTALLDAIDDWAYVRALLESDPPVYDDTPRDRPSLDVDHEDEIAAAIAAGDKTKALSIYRTWRPMGRCSMDDRPAKVARDYAELCYDLGKLGCFLQLQVQIMGDRFNRVAWSTYGDEAASTQAERLYETGLDVDVFLSGLALHFAGVSRRGEIGMRRLARSIKEAGQTDVVAARLAAWAKDPDFDEYNRLGAVQLLSHLDRDAMVDDDDLPEIPRMWRALELSRAEEAFKNGSH